MQYSDLGRHAGEKLSPAGCGVGLGPFAVDIVVVVIDNDD
jgi:hypothetical protein